MVALWRTCAADEAPGVVARLHVLPELAVGVVEDVGVVVQVVEALRGTAPCPRRPPLSNSGTVRRKNSGLATWSASKMHMISEPGMGTACTAQPLWEVGLKSIRLHAPSW